jgi:hypothetical protein
MISTLALYRCEVARCKSHTHRVCGHGGVIVRDMFDREESQFDGKDK